MAKGENNRISVQVKAEKSVQFKFLSLDRPKLNPHFCISNIPRVILMLMCIFIIIFLTITKYATVFFICTEP